MEGKSHFAFVPRDTEESEFLDSVDCGCVAFSVKSIMSISRATISSIYLSISISSIYLSLSHRSIYLYLIDLSIYLYLIHSSLSLYLIDLSFYLYLIHLSIYLSICLRRLGFVDSELIQHVATDMALYLCIYLSSYYSAVGLSIYVALGSWIAS